MPGSGDPGLEALRPARVAAYRAALALQRRAALEPFPRPSPLSEEAGLRGMLLRAGAAWLIGYASLLAFLSWAR
jgi:hypothetical protein